MATAYEELLVEYKPRPIDSEREYRRALSAVDRLMQSSGTNPAKPQRDMIDLLATMIQRYESEHFPAIPAATPAELLAHLIENRKVTQTELAEATGVSRATIANVVAGRRGLSKAGARKLADYFGVGIELFVA